MYAVHTPTLYILPVKVDRPFLSPPTYILRSDKDPKKSDAGFPNLETNAGMFRPTSTNSPGSATKGEYIVSDVPL